MGCGGVYSSYPVVADGELKNRREKCQKMSFSTRSKNFGVPYHMHGAPKLVRLEVALTLFFHFFACLT